MGQRGLDTAGTKRGAPSRLWSILGLCAICIALNVLGAQLALAFNLPVYLDSLGTILASMIGGYIPGIVVGYLTNLINSLFSNTAIYYGIINVLIAIVTAYLTQRGWFRRLPMALVAILIITLITGILGSIVEFFLGGAHLGDTLAASFAQQLYATGSFDAFGAQVVADLFINLVDKMLVVLFAMLIWNMLPEEQLAKLDFHPWSQAPLSKSDLAAAMNAKPRGMSLSTKTIVLVAIIMVLVVLATTIFSYLAFNKSMVDNEAVKAKGVTNLMAEAVDPDRVEDYLTYGEDAPGYTETESVLAEIRDSFDDVQYVYVYKIMEDGCHVVLDPDTAEEPGSEPGEIIGFDEAFKKYVPALLEGEEIDPIISNEDYGWLLTVYTPLKDEAGETVCYLAADISMTHLVSDEIAFIASILTLFAAFFILVCAIVLWMTRYGIIVPVNSIARASNRFMLSEGHARSEGVEKLQALDIHTGDEVENLYTALVHMAQDATRYIEDAQEKNETIARMQDNLIMVMADLVESRDKFTGDHVRNTAAYTRVVMSQMRREGIYPDQLTNEFISNVYKSAPLHDVGKIVVSDTILNKPGRLTDEEFRIMQSHTLAGKKILEDAKGAVSESSYLDEAQNLAAYHHEKWNGTGYPYGLAGEDIPLSARIMAVADVFDALVSKRSYKAGFSVEKALEIIEEGIGTHFDPLVARAFLHAQDKARVIVAQSEERKRQEEEAAAAAAAAEAADKADSDNGSSR